MFKFKRVEEIKAKMKKMKIAGITVAVVFLLMLLNIMYLNFKVSQLSGNQAEILDLLSKINFANWYVFSILQVFPS